MKKVETIIESDRLTAVKEALTNIGISGMTVSEVHAHGNRQGGEVVYRGQKYNVDLLPKVRFEVVVANERLAEAVDAIALAGHAGKIGDNQILVYDVAEAIRIRNGVSDTAGWATPPARGLSAN
jgi:nitrogen regulatory protein P-II 1